MSSNDVKAVFLFNLSKAGMNQELIQTGQRGAMGRKVEVSFSELSPEDRAFVLECGRDIGSVIEVTLQEITLNDNVYATRVEDEAEWIKSTKIELDAMPTITAAITLARQLRDRGKPIREQAKAKATEAKEAAARHRNRNLAAYQELHNKLYHPETGLIANGNLEALKKWSWKDSTGHTLDADFTPRNHEIEAMILYANGRALRYKNTGSVVEDAIKELEKDAAEAEKDRWIQAHGSKHLREAWLSGYPSSREYLIERAAMEFPGFTLDFGDNGEDKGRSFPSESALKAEKHLNSFGVNCRVVWVTAWPTSKRNEYDEWDNEDDRSCEAIVVRNWHGKDLYAQPKSIDLARPYGEAVYQKKA